MKGISKAEVARQLGVSRQSVQNWAVRLRVERMTGAGNLMTASFQSEQDRFLRNKKQYKSIYSDLRCQELGRPNKVSKENIGKLKKALKAGAKAVGYAADKWTLAKIKKWIEKEYLGGDQTISRTQVMRHLQELGFSCEKPSLDDQARLRKWERLGWIEV